MPRKTDKTDTSATAAVREGSKGGGKPRDYADVNALPDELKAVVQKELREGGSIEDAAELVGATGRGTIEAHAVERFFRKNVALQNERFANQLEAARGLRQVLGSKPDSPEADFAFAALVTGLAGLRRHDQASAPVRAMRVLKDGSDLHFKDAGSERQEKKLVISERESRVRAQAMQVQLRMAKLRLEQLQQAIGRQGKDKTLGPEILQQINEIYGIVTAPTPE